MKQVEKMDYSTVVFDTAPTGHTLRLLSFPSMLEGAFGKIMAFKNKFSGLMSQFSGMMGQAPGACVCVCVCVCVCEGGKEGERYRHMHMQVGVL